MLNAKGKVLHVCSLDKFIPPFIDFVEEHFDDFATRHVFFITGDIERYPYRARANIDQAQQGKKAQLLHLAKLAVAMQQADKIILHGLFNQHVVCLLFAIPWVLKKCYWVMWGGDLYVYKLGNHNSTRWALNEFFRRPVIRNVGNLIGALGDVELARKWYNACGRHIQEEMTYPSNVFEPNKSRKKTHSGVNILIGNSADPSNNHKEVLDKLILYKNNNIKIFSPLSYGNQEYAREVIDYGKIIFEEKFFPITEFLERDKYLEFLQTIDIAIFNHKRQQAFGNTINLLGYGAKVLIRNESILNKTFKNIGIIIFDSENIEIEKIEPCVAEKNTKIITSIYSENNLVKSLKSWML